MIAPGRLFLLVATIGAAAAARGEVKVADDVPDDGASFSGIDHGISERLQRAWLVLHFTEDTCSSTAPGPGRTWCDGWPG
jgi:hypothetical protein